MLQQFAIEMDGLAAGRLLTLNPGMPVASVTMLPVGGAGFEKKPIGQVQFPATSFTCGAGMSKAFYEWVNQTLNTPVFRQKATVIAFNEKYELVYRLEFSDAQIGEVTFPALDAASKNPASLTVKIVPSRARMHYGHSPGASKQPLNLGIYKGSGTKPWQISDFRLNIEGLNTACSRVTTIDSVTARFSFSSETRGETRDDSPIRVKSEFSNLVITVPSMYLNEFVAWEKSSVIEGKNTDDQEKDGFLEFLPPHSTNPYFRVDFKHLGIISIAAPQGASGSPVRVVMYCENMEFTYYNMAVLG